MIDRMEELVTVFGGGGFIGRYVCEFLLKSGVRVRIAQRNPRQAYIIQPLGQVGQFGFVAADITKPDSVRHALHGASAAINLCGVFGNKMRAVHVDGARNVAEVAREAGVEALVQISAIGADVHSKSLYGESKAEGELAAREAFPGATIIRPSLVFGPEDELTNRFAGMARLPFLPVIAGRTNFQPVYVRDLAKAIAMAALVLIGLVVTLLARDDGGAKPAARGTGATAVSTAPSVPAKTPAPTTPAVTVAAASGNPIVASMVEMVSTLYYERRRQTGAGADRLGEVPPHCRQIRGHDGFLFGARGGLARERRARLIELVGDALHAVVGLRD